MIRKNLFKTACALSAAIIALSSVPVAAEEITTPTEQVQEDTTGTVDETVKKSKHKKHRKSEISEAVNLAMLPLILNIKILSLEFANIESWHDQTTSSLQTKP